MRRLPHLAASWLLAHTLLALSGAPVLRAQAAAQDANPIGQAKALYASADYDGSLALLAAIEVASPAGASYEVHYYRALCLLAIGRTEDAERAMAATVEARPEFSPSASDISPRIQALFSDVRERLLPQIARKRLTEARGVSRDGDPARALAAIDGALALLNDPKLTARTDLDDLRLAAGTMRELANAQVVSAQAALARNAASAPVQPPAAPAAPTPSTAAATPEAAAPVATGTSAVTGAPAGARPATAAAAPVVPAIVPPVAVKQDMPRWNPTGALAREASTGSIRVQIDASGRVTGAAMEQPVHPSFDVLMVEAAKAWRYRPAMRNGQPIPWESVVAIKVAPPTR